jgi:drug/metabolite transporter (DMT)-like permease
LNPEAGPASPGMTSRDMELVGGGYALLAAAGFGAQSVAIKLAYRAGVSVPTLLAVRNSLAAAALWLLVLGMRVPHRPSPPRARRLIALGAFSFTASGALLLGALNRMPAGTAVLILYTYPTLLALTSRALGREQIGLWKGLLLGVSFIGVASVVGFHPDRLDPLGTVMAFGASLSTAVYALLFERMGAGVHPLASSALVMTGAAACVILVLGPTGYVHVRVGLEAWGWLLLIGIILISLSLTFYAAALARIGPTRTAIASTLEPLVTVVLAAVILGEQVTTGEVLGGLLLLAAAGMLPLLRARVSPRGAPPNPASTPIRH